MPASPRSDSQTETRSVLTRRVGREEEEWGGVVVV
jgi:hypothetical protein